MHSLAHLALLVSLASTAPPLLAQSRKPKDDVLAAGQAVFDAMARRDTTALKTLLHPIAHFVATIETADSVQVRGTTRDEFFRQIGSIAAVPRERMWNSEVRVSGAIATIWTPYDFHLGTKLSHCGIDSFQLVRSTQGWQVTSIIYTIVAPPDRCSASPLGPVQ